MPSDNANPEASETSPGENPGDKRSRFAFENPRPEDDPIDTLRRIGELVGRGRLVGEALEIIGISEKIYYSWLAALRSSADMGHPSSRSRLQRLEVENSLLRNALSAVCS